MKTAINKIFILILLVTTTTVIYSQHDPLFTHAAVARTIVNPAYSGYRDNFAIKILHRSQWVGFEDAPNTQLLAFHMPILDKRAGVGFSTIHDNFNPKRSTSFFGDFAYKIPISRDRGVVSFGVKAGINSVSLDLASLSTVQKSDPSFSKNIRTRLLPNFGVGFLYKADNFYVGLSVPRLIQSKYTLVKDTYALKERIHFYAITGSKHEISENFELSQSISLRAIHGSPMQFQVLGTVKIKDTYEVTTVLRTGDALGLMLGYHVTKAIWAGYSYDWSFNNRTFKYNGGSHELIMKYEIDFTPKGRNSRY